MKQKLSLQDFVFDALITNGISANIIVTNGYQINNAKIIAFDNFVEANNKQTMIYKHAVSSIIPIGKLDISPFLSE